MHNVYIRPLREEDALTSYQWRNDPEVWKFTGSRPDNIITPEIEKQWLIKVLNDDTCRRFAIIADHTYIGNIQLTNINDIEAEYHIFIGDKLWWGKRIAHLATYQLLHFAKEILNIEKVRLRVKQENISAIKSYERSGFKEIGIKDSWLHMECVLSYLMPPKVSVLCMVYNHEKYIEDAIKGYLEQKMSFNSVMVIGEDFSTDSSRMIIKKYAENYPGKFKLLLHKNNVGAYKNQEMLLNCCDGDYVAICEGDDFWIDPNKLQKQADLLDKFQNIGLVFTDVNKIDENNQVFVNKFLSTNEYSNIETFNDYLIHAPFRAPCSWLFRKSLIHVNVSSNSDLIGDLSMLLSIAKYSEIYFLKEVTAHYRVLNSSASHFKDERLQYIFNQKVLKTQLYFAENQNQINKLILNFTKSNFRNYLKYGSTNNRYFLNNAKKFPLFKRLLIYLKTVFK